MHVLIVGHRGQLGRAFLDHYQQRGTEQVTGWDMDECDITDPIITDQIVALNPDLVINAAAWTNVDAAESRPDTVYAVNVLGPKHLAEACARCDAAMVQISTNEVFPGEPGRFYREYDERAARGVYARSKLAAERAAQQMLDRLMVVRIAWLFGPGAVNFPTKIAEAADRHGKLRVVSDEFGNPTYAPDAVRAIARLADLDRPGFYHLTNSGYCSRFTFAETVLELSGRGHVPITPITADEWTRPAPPPLHAVLINQAAAALGVTMRPWEEALAEFVGEYMTSEA
jgi:dTDP-4-dehydrorhamnose reductase